MAAAAPSWDALLQSGNYAAAFQSASQSGDLAQAVDPATLAKLYPKGMSEAQYEQFYSAFAPYEANMAGSTVAAANEGGNANQMWDSPLTAAQLKTAADTQYQQNTDLQAVQADQAALAKLGPVAAGGAFGGGPTAAQTTAQNNLTAATNKYDAIAPGGEGGFGQGGAVPTTAASDVANVYGTTLTGGLTEGKPDKAFVDEWANSGGPLELIAAIAAPELAPVLAGALGGGAAATIGAGAAVGAGGGALVGAVSGGNVGEDALMGGITGGLGASAPAISAATGGTITPAEASILAKTVGGEITGGTQGAENALIAGGVGLGLQESGATGALQSDLGNTVGSAVAKTGGSLVASGIESEIGTAGNVQSTSLTPKFEASSETYGSAPASAVSSPSGGTMASTSAAGSGAVNTELSPSSTDVGGSDLSSLSSLTGISTDPTLGMGTDPSNSTSTTPSALSSLGSLLPSGSTLAGLAPYLAMGGAGLLEQQQAASETNSEVNQLEGLGAPLLSEGNTLLGNYQAGQLTPAQQAVTSNAMSSANTLLTSAQPLSGIAATAFSQYQSGTLPAWQQQQLDAQTAAAKQQVAQSLASQGITDSSVLQAQYQQIDSQAAITKGQLNQQNFATGNQAYDTWLTSTTQGQQLQQQGLQYAAQSLQQTFANALGADSLGGQDVQAAIQLAVQSNSQLAEMMTQFMGSLATAYAISQGGTGAAGKAGSSSGLSIGAPSIGGSTASSGGASTPGSLSNTSDTLDTANTNLTGNAALSTDFNDPNLLNTLNDPGLNSTNQLGQTQMGGSYDAYQNPLNYDETLGFGTTDLSSGGFDSSSDI